MKTKNIAIILIIGVLIAVVGIGAGCGEKEAEKEKAQEEKEEKKEEEKKVEEKEESLVDILAKAKTITSVKYDVVITIPGQPDMTQKVWIKGEKARTEMTLWEQGMIYLMDYNKKVMYVYYPAENTAMKMDLSEIQEDVGESPLDQDAIITKYNPVVIGSEIIDGKDCLVIEYTITEITAKAWIWKKYGLLVKTETPLPTGGISTLEITNIDFGDISDSMFELPAGVEITDTPGGF